jgi:hypothetical protein
MALQSKSGLGLLFWGFLIVLFRHGRTHLDKWSARRKGLYLYRTTQHRNTKTNIHVPSGIRTHDPSNQAANTYPLDRAATGTGRDWIITYYSEERQLQILSCILTTDACTVRRRENPCGAIAALVRYGGMFTTRRTRRLLLVGSMTCKRLTLLHRLKRNKQLRVACSQCNFTVYCVCSDNIPDWITGDLKQSSVREHKKSCCLSRVQFLWNRCFQDG